MLSSPPHSSAISQKLSCWAMHLPTSRAMTALTYAPQGSRFCGSSRQALAQRTSRAWRLARPSQGSHKRLRVCAGLADTAELLVFSALPFVAVQALADSKWGKELQQNLERQKVVLKKEGAAWEASRRRARQQSKWYGPDRPRWLGPLAYDYPAHLTGELPGDYGYDPLGLGRDPQKLDRYFELELFHARWAMLAALGALLPEALQLAGKADFLEPVWWRVGAAKLGGEDLNYLGVAGLRIAGGQGIAIIAICQVVLMFGPEYARACGIEALEPLGLYLPGDKNYPGSWLFDPLGLSKDGAKFEELRVKEIKNGRLAMVAWAGFFAQAAVTREGPVGNLEEVLLK